MTEIWNLSTLCRCCHADGHFKSLSLSYQGKNEVEIYEKMLRESLGIIISTPPLEASYTICDTCILKLSDAANFKKQVLKCEEKFQFYCNNEQFSVSHDIKSEEESESHRDDIKSESESDSHQDNMENLNEINKNLAPDVKTEYAIEINTEHQIQGIKKENQPKTEILTVEDRRTTEESSEIPKKTLKNNVNSNRRKITKHKEKRKKRVNLDLSLIIQVDTETGTQYSCKNCAGLYKTQKEINQHIMKSHSPLHKCEYCEKELKSFHTYKNHLKLHTGKNNQCTICSKKFTSKISLKDHLNSHTREKAYKCDICKNDFRYKTSLIRHLKIHSGTNKKILCHLCGRSFNDQANLNSHTQSVHEKLRPFHCKICKKSYTTQRHLRDHLKLHSGDQKFYNCDICDYRVICPKSLKVHRLKHEGKFMCRQCSEVFDDAASKTEHIKIMHKTNVTCPTCGKTYLDKFSLKRHLDDHKGIKKFSCNICGVDFTQKVSLQRHTLRKHENQPDFNINNTKCNICKRHVKNMAAHIERHNTRLFGCEICGKTYPDNSGLNRHKQKHLGKRFECDICNKTYMQKGKLNSHRLKIHQIKIEKNSGEG